MNRLKYISSESFFEGIIIEVTDGSVLIDFKGRMGQLSVPRRMVITDYELKPGQEVGFMMTYPEVLSQQVDEEYAKLAKMQLERKRISEAKKYLEEVQENSQTEE